MNLGETILIELNKYELSKKDLYAGKYKDKFFYLKKDEDGNIVFSVHNNGEDPVYFSTKLREIPKDLGNRILKRLYDESGEYKIQKYKDYEEKMKEIGVYDEIKEKNRLKNFVFKGNLKISEQYSHHGLFFDRDNDEIYLILVNPTKEIRLMQILNSKFKEYKEF